MGLAGFLRQKPLIPLLLTAGILSACAETVTETVSNPPTPQVPEKPYSATPTTYTGDTTLVTGTATFKRYDDNSSGLTSISGGHPIRHAEVHIFDSAGQRIQQGETDANGNISMTIPRVAGSYGLHVNSRADNDYYRASVLNNPYDNEYYSVVTNFDLNGTEATMSLTVTEAPAANNTSVLGGAFNILDQIYLANDFLRRKANLACPAGCATNFTTAPKIQIYWTKGVSPGAYYGAPSVPISFFTNISSGNIYRGLYILGGIQGSVCTDTDHFDRSVILHEYGHYLEAALGRSSSPGGSHDGNSVIDPRLAWSEGWADFFQAAVLGRNFYRDTTSNAHCSSGASLGFADFGMETDSRDTPGTNEGIFREMSVARALYDMMTGPSQGSGDNMDADSDGLVADLGFNFIWHAFKELGSSLYRFQNMGIFNEISDGFVQANYDSSTQDKFGDILITEKQPAHQELFGLKLTPQMGATCTFSFQSGVPVPNIWDPATNELVDSHLIKSNAFFRYDFDGPSPNGIIYLRYNGSSGNPYDLDLYVYREDYVFLDSYYLHAYSVRVHPESGGISGYPGAENINLNGQAGTYMINVMVDTFGPAKNTTTYYLETASGARLCP